MTADLPGSIRNLRDDAWLDLLIRSVGEPRLDGVDFPRFPSQALQARWVGSADEATLREAFAFYVLVKGWAKKLRNPLRQESRFLDFGCGWGRFLRFFWKDINAANLYGCDMSNEIVATCRELAVPGTIDLIEPRGTLPYQDAHFDALMAYSVFPHLPKSIHLHWMRELARVTKPSGMFAITIEPRRFIDFLQAIPSDTDVYWYQKLSTFKNQASDFYRRYDSGDLDFMPTNEGVEETYGDAVVPRSFIEREWAPHFKVVEYIDNPGPLLAGGRRSPAHVTHRR